jgi:hypothetical protein
MTGEFKCDPASGANALANALGKIEVMAVAGRKVRAGLGNADDRFAGSQFRRRKPKIQIALEIKRGHSGVFWIVEPKL